MLKHQISDQNGEDTEFVKRTVSYHRTALNRQIAEAGSILNSKAEFDHCQIPRLIVEEQDKKVIDKAEEQEREAEV